MIEINWNPDRRQLRHFGLICLVFFGVIASWVSLRHGILGFGMTRQTAMITAAVLAGLAGISGILAAAAPHALRYLFVGLSALTFPVGWVVSNVLMALLYYGVVTPIGLALRLTQRSTIRRGFEPQAKSYWTPRSSSTDTQQYFRQF